MTSVFVKLQAEFETSMMERFCEKVNKPWFLDPTLVKLLQRDLNPQPEILRMDSL